LQNQVRTPDEIVSLLDAVQPSDIARVAKSVLNDEQMRLAVVGPRGGAKTLADMLHF